ncbi:helix-turn-helix domain-containing protein [Sinomicrobium sp.]
MSAAKVERVYKVQDYADAQNLNANYLSNVIKSKTGKPITSWIADKTIAEAKLLLEKSTLSIKEISYRLGFSETAHFSNYFKKHTAMSPLTYSKQH